MKYYKHVYENSQFIISDHPQPHPPPIGGGAGPEPEGPKPPNFLDGGFGGLQLKRIRINRI